ncbi:MAG TPA: metallophosphoesterase [Labilithrix sp.]|nr:metallophosphoesterase [Labilithrix sp.]
MPAPALVVAAAAVGSALAFTRVNAAHRGGLAITHHQLPWRGHRRFRVAHLTDIHVGPTTPRPMLERVAEVVHLLDCDVVVLTGDYVNMSLSYRDRITDFIRLLPKPCIATLGNHDHWTDPVRVATALETGGAEVLRNESTVVQSAGASLVVVGVDDGRSGNADVERAFANVPRADTVLTLSHFPSTAERIAKTGAPLVLSGHTHAGHVDVPRVTQAFAKLAGNPYLHGFYRIDATDLYVNAGIGHSLHGLRAGRACPEVAIFDLDPDARERRTLTMRTSMF